MALTRSKCWSPPKHLSTDEKDEVFKTRRNALEIGSRTSRGLLEYGSERVGEWPRSRSATDVAGTSLRVISTKSRLPFGATQSLTEPPIRSFDED